MIVISPIVFEGLILMMYTLLYTQSASKQLVSPINLNYFHPAGVLWGGNIRGAVGGRFYLVPDAIQIARKGLSR